jgi:hypothetical protein
LPRLGDKPREDQTDHRQRDGSSHIGA